MGTTRQIAPADWKSYFDRFTREHLLERDSDNATLELISPTLSEQLEVKTARLLGLIYDPRDNTFEVWLQDFDHLSYHPRQIWVVEDGGSGFISALEITRSDGTTEIMYVHRTTPVARPFEQASARR